MLTARTLLVGFGVALVLIVLLPSDNHQALGLLPKLARWAASFGVPYRFAFHGIEFSANIAMFVPFGVLVPLAIGSLRVGVLVVTVCAGFALSACIEIAQKFIPGRVSDPRDLLANTLGALLGVLLLLGYWRLRRRAAHNQPA